MIAPHHIASNLTYHERQFVRAGGPCGDMPDPERFRLEVKMESLGLWDGGDGAPRPLLKEVASHLDVLEGCPFCKAAGEQVSELMYEGKWLVLCDGCGANGPEQKRQKDARRMWNGAPRCS